MKNLKLIKVIVSSLVVASVLSLNTIGVSADTHTYTDGVITRYEWTNIYVGEFRKIKFIKEDGTYARNEWIHQEGYSPTWGNYSQWIYFDNDCLNVDGWFQLDGEWYYADPCHYSDSYGIAANCFIEDYYLGEDGTIVTNRWIKEDIYNYGNITGCNWYYIGSDGKKLINTTTPDGYKVDKKGILIQ